MADALVHSMNRRRVGSASNIGLESFNFLQFRRDTSVSLKAYSSCTDRLQESEKDLYSKLYIA